MVGAEGEDVDLRPRDEKTKRRKGARLSETGQVTLLMVVLKVVEVVAVTTPLHPAA